MDFPTAVLIVVIQVAVIWAAYDMGKKQGRNK